MTDGTPSSADLRDLRDRRAPGSGAPDAVRLRFLEALAARAATRSAPVRAMLEARLAELTARHAQTPPRAPALAAEPAPEPAPEPLPSPATAPRSPAALPASPATAPPAPGPLAALLATLVRPGEAAGAAGPAGGAASLAQRAAGAEPPLRAYFESTWSRLAAQQRLAQLQAAVPDNAGPLHSQQLVYRSLALMHELSPACLERFFAHAAALAWLEQWQHAQTVPAAPAAPRRGSGRPPASPTAKVSRR